MRDLNLVRQRSIQFFSPLPLAALEGEGQAGGKTTARTRHESPLPNPPPQAGEGAEKPFVHAN
jgi:hypothetical protein